MAKISRRAKICLKQKITIISNISNVNSVYTDIGIAINFLRWKCHLEINYRLLGWVSTKVKNVQEKCFLEKIVNDSSLYLNISSALDSSTRVQCPDSQYVIFSKNYLVNLSLRSKLLQVTILSFFILAIFYIVS